MSAACDAITSEFDLLESETDGLADPWHQRAERLATLVEAAVEAGCDEVRQKLVWEAQIAFAYTTNAAVLNDDRERFAQFHPDLLTEEALAYLGSGVNSESALVRSKVRDFLWEKGGGIHGAAGAGAARAYLEAVDLWIPRIDDDSEFWTKLGDPLVRAANLARRANQLDVLRQSADRSLSLLRRYAEGDSLRQALDPILALIQASTVLSPEEQSEVETTIRGIAANIDKGGGGGDAHLAHAAYELLKRFAQRCGRSRDTMREIELAIIDSFVTEGQRQHEAGNDLIASVAYQDALRLTKKLGGEPQLLNDLRARLRDAREAGISQMATVTTRPIEIPRDQLEPVISEVATASVPLCLRMIAVHPALTLRRADAVASHEAGAQIAPLSAMPPRVTLRSGGQALAPVTSEEAERLRLFQHASLQLRIQEGLFLNDIVDRLRDREDVTPEAVLEHLSSAGALPDDNAPLVEVGLRRLWEGDWVSAIHVLVPQLEDILRTLMRAHGRDPMRSSRSVPGVTMEATLGVILSELRDAGADDGNLFMLEVAFDLYGYNLRNDTAHGFLRIGDCTRDNAYRVLQIYLIAAELFVAAADPPAGP